MTTRDILAEILRNPDIARTVFHAMGDDGEPEPYPSVAIHDSDEIAERGADAILADKRLGIVELPEPKRPTDSGALWFGDYRACYSPISEAAGLPCVQIHGETGMHRSAARKLAAALLAAANAIEEKP